MGPMARAKTGMPKASATSSLLVMSAISAASSCAAPELSNVMPHLAQTPGWSLSIPGHIGQKKAAEEWLRGGGLPRKRC